MELKSSYFADTWKPYVEDAAWLPLRHDAARETLTFAHLPRPAQRRAVFVDPRFVADAQTSPPLRLADAPLTCVRNRRGPIHFIFHTAFCCSTLLARALDIPGLSMGLKEPGVLMDLSTALAPNRQTAARRTALALTLDLLSRPLAEGETQIVKANNASNTILRQILDARPDAKAILLHASLESFLGAVARKGFHGRSFGRTMYAHLSEAIPLPVDYAMQHLLTLTDLQLAAHVWLMQAAVFADVARQYGPERVRLLDSARFLEDTAGVLLQAARFFEIALAPAQAEAIAQGPVFREHAKQPGLPFDTEMHWRQEEHAQRLHLEEIEFVRAWAHVLARRCNTPASLGDTLCAV